MNKKTLYLFIAILILGLFPYVIGGPLVLAAFVPYLYLIYSKDRVHWPWILMVVFVSWSINLFPFIFFSLEAYIEFIIITTAFFIAFLSASGFLISRCKHAKLHVLIPPFVWMSLLYIFDFNKVLTSGFELGILFPRMAPIIWYIGSPGVTFLIVLFHSSTAFFLASRQKRHLILPIALGLIFASCFIYSATRNGASFSDEKKPIRVALIQGNFPKEWEWLQDNAGAILDRYKELTLMAAGERPEIIFWPEFALNVDFINYNPKLRRSVEDLAVKAGATLVIGSVRYDDATDLHTDSALVFDKDGKFKYEYSSVDPAPFNTFVMKGKGPLKVFDGFGVMVCWEEINSNISREYVNKGASYLVSIANNQNLDKTYLQRFSSYYTRARAAENMRYFVRATNTGITQIIDPCGKVIKSLPPLQSAYMIGDIYPINRKTFYSQYGDVLTKGALILIGLALVLAIIIPSKKVK